MKQAIITILLALVAMAGQAQTFTWRIEGTVANAVPTDTLTVIDAEKQRMITTLQVKDGNIVPASGMLDEPAVCCIAKQGRRGWIRIQAHEHLWSDRDSPQDSLCPRRHHPLPQNCKQQRT